MDTALVVTWKTPFPGREKQALDYGAEVNEYWGKLAADGKCTTPEMFFFPQGSGMWIVRGERQSLEDLFWDDPSQKLMFKGPLLLGDFGWTFARAGAGADAFMLSYADAAQGLGVL